MNQEYPKSTESANECQSIRVMNVCPECGKRLLDKITPTTGKIEMKCPRCNKIVELNLSFRRGPSLRSFYRR